MKNKAIYYNTIKGWIMSCTNHDQLKVATEAIEIYTNRFGSDDYSVHLYEVALAQVDVYSVENDIFDQKNMD